MTSSVKTAVSFPREAFQRLETIRKRTHQSRSRILLVAFQSWVKQQELEALEQRYVAGYAREPEIVADVEGFYRVGLTSLQQEPW